MNWSDIVQYFHKRPNAVFAFASTGLVVLFIPVVSKFFLINKLPPVWQGVLGVITLFSIFTLLTLPYEKAKRAIRRKASLKNLDSMSDSELLVIAECLEQNTTTAHTFYPSIGLALSEKGLLKIVCDENNRVNIAYILEQHAWDAIQTRRDEILKRAEQIRERYRHDAEERESREKQQRDDYSHRGW